MGFLLFVCLVWIERVVTALKGIKGTSRIIRRSANLLSLLPYGRAFLGCERRRVCVLSRHCAVFLESLIEKCEGSIFLFYGFEFWTFAGALLSEKIILASPFEAFVLFEDAATRMNVASHTAFSNFHAYRLLPRSVLRVYLRDALGLYCESQVWAVGV
jgi:hypothetical protein